MSDTEKTIADEILERAEPNAFMGMEYTMAEIALQFLIENSKNYELRFLESALRSLRAAKRESGK